MTQRVNVRTGRKEVEFWSRRAKKYEQLEWARRGSYLHTFIDFGEFSETETVLDVGSGTGIVATSVAPFVKKVVGVDICEKMMQKAAAHGTPNAVFVKGDLHRLPFDSGIFDRVTARMVFHHLVHRPQDGMRECFRVLKKKGVMVFSEGVPPTRHVIPFYTEMFKLKEERITFTAASMAHLMRGAGFRGIRKKTLVIPQCSIRNWLENANLPRPVQDKIFRMHLDLDDKGKRDYRMSVRGGDCLIDMTFVLLKGVKP